MSSRGTETSPPAPVEAAATTTATIQTQQQDKSESTPEFVAGLPPGLRTDSLVITNNNGEVFFYDGRFI